jgi:hypothetical protein
MGILTKKEAIKQSITHWKRMIEWAEKQGKRQSKSYLQMDTEIHETPSTGDCFLCTKYLYFNTHNEAGCIKHCPLKEKYGLECFDNKSIYHKTAVAKTWGAWVKEAKLMLKALEGLLE